MQNYTHFLSNIKLFLFFFAMNRGQKNREQRGRRQKSENREAEVRKQRGRSQKTENRGQNRAIANLIAPLLLCSLPSAL